MKILLLLLSALCLLLTANSHAQDTIDYRIKMLPTPVVDLNNRGDTITDDALILKNGLSTSLVCPGSDVGGIDNTVPTKLTNKATVAGYCFQPGIGDVGFLRRPKRNGHYDFLAVPGASATFLFGVNDNDVAAGQYFNGDYHGLLWDGITVTTIDFPAPGAQTACLGVTTDRVAACAYFTFNPITNEGSEWTAFLWSNGNVIPLNFPGAHLSFPLDIDENGTILTRLNTGLGFDGGPGEPVNGEIFVDNDGVLSRIGLPATVDGLPASFQIEGMNNKGQLAGGLTTFDCIGPFNCTVNVRGFIATPTKH